MWVGQLCALQEEQADPAWIDGDGKYRLRCFVAGPKTNSQCIVVVIDDFRGAGQPFAEPRQSGACGSGDTGLEFGEKACELPCGSSCRRDGHKVNGCRDPGSCAFASRFAMYCPNGPSPLPGGRRTACSTEPRAIAHPPL